MLDKIEPDKMCESNQLSPAGGKIEPALPKVSITDVEVTITPTVDFSSNIEYKN